MLPAIASWVMAPHPSDTCPAHPHDTAREAVASQTATVAARWVLASDRWRRASAIADGMQGERSLPVSQGSRSGANANAKGVPTSVSSEACGPATGTA